MGRLVVYINTKTLFDASRLVHGKKQGHCLSRKINRDPLYVVKMFLTFSNKITVTDKYKHE